MYISTCNTGPDHAILSTVCRVRMSLFPPHQAESDIKTISKKIILKEEESQ